MLLKRTLLSTKNLKLKTVKNAINWFEIPVTDFKRAKKFYETIFESEIQEMDVANFKMGVLPHDMEGGGVGGAICCGEGFEPAADKGSRLYLNGGSDLNTVLNRVESAGGKVTLPKTDIGEGFGHMGLFADTEGNIIGLYSQS